MSHDSPLESQLEAEERARQIRAAKASPAPQPTPAQIHEEAMFKMRHEVKQSAPQPEGTCPKCGQTTMNVRTKSGYTGYLCDDPWHKSEPPAPPAGAREFANRLELAEKKLAEQGIVWEEGKGYVFDGKS